jgi:hypothetical protein
MNQRFVPARPRAGIHNHGRVDSVGLMTMGPRFRGEEASQFVARKPGDQRGISLMVRTTLEVGRELTVGSLFSFITISSYCGSGCSGVLATMCTTL